MKPVILIFALFLFSCEMENVEPIKKQNVNSLNIDLIGLWRLQEATYNNKDAGIGPDRGAGIWFYEDSTYLRKSYVTDEGIYVWTEIRGDWSLADTLLSFDTIPYTYRLDTGVLLSGKSYLILDGFEFQEIFEKAEF